MVCKKCGEDKEERCFPYKRNTCRECRCNNSKIKRNIGKEFINTFKHETGCSSCKETNPVVLEFHHTHDKEYKVSRMIELPIQKIKEEMSKCIVLCANCHRILHHDEKRAASEGKEAAQATGAERSLRSPVTLMHLDLEEVSPQEEV